MATSFPTALEEETDMSLTNLMEDNEMPDVNWWGNFTKYYDGVSNLKDRVSSKDTVYYIND